MIVTQAVWSYSLSKVENISFPLWRCGPTGAMTSSFFRFIDRTHRRTTGGRTPLDEWSVRRRDLYAITHNSRRISMPTAGFEPTIPEKECGRRPTPQTARPLGSAVENITRHIYGTEYFRQDMKFVYRLIPPPRVATESVLLFFFRNPTPSWARWIQPTRSYYVSYKRILLFSSIHIKVT